MHLTRVSVAFIRLLDFFDDFVFLSFVVINRLRRGGSGFGLRNSLESRCQFVYKDVHFEKTYLAQVCFSLV